MKTVFKVLGFGGAGLAVAGTGIGISSATSSNNPERGVVDTSTGRNDLKGKNDLGDPETTSLADSEQTPLAKQETDYKSFQKKLQEIKEEAQGSNISQKIKELEEIIKKVGDEDLERIEIELYPEKAEINRKFPGNDPDLTRILQDVVKRKEQYQKEKKLRERGEAEED